MGLETMLIILAAITGVLAVVGVLVVYGTVAKNEWGVNLDRVSCPRCNTPAPTPPEPRSFRQARWGEWTCPVCGAEVDKWGRELPSVAPCGRVMSAAQFGAVLKKWTIITLPAGYFTLSLLFYWVRGWRPSTWVEALFQLTLSIVETAIFTVLYLLAWKLFERFFLAKKGRDPR